MRQQVALHGKDNRISGVDPIPPGRWEYAGTADPFLNGWENVGGGLQQFRWRRTNENQTEIQGFIQAGTANPVINLPDPYRPDEIQPAIGYDSVGNILLWKLYPNGDLTIDQTITGLTIATLEAIGGLHWGTNTDTNGDGLILDGTGTNFEFDSGGGGFEIRSGSGGLLVDSEGGLLEIKSGASAMELSGVSVTARSDELVWARDTDGNTILSHVTGVGLTARIFTGETHTILDDGGNPIMQLDEDGTLHLKSGASIVYDL